MKKAKVIAGIFSAVLVAAMSGVASANFVEFDASGTTDGPVSAAVVIQSVNGGLAIKVYNLETGSESQGQAISSLSFGVSGINTPSAFTEISGNVLQTVNSGWSLGSGTFQDDTSSSPPVNSIDHWGFSNSSGVLLATAGSPVPGSGNPHYMILGPSGTASGNPDSNFDPYFIGSATFYLTVSGMTSGTTLSSSNFTGLKVGFGTGPDKSFSGTYVPNGGQPPPVPVPLPGAFASGAVLLGGLAAGAKIRKKMAH